MIRVDVEPYCSECLDFTPDVEEPVRFYSGLNAVCQTDTIVRCKHQKRCENMVRYLQKQMDKPKD